MPYRHLFWAIMAFGLISARLGAEGNWWLEAKGGFEPLRQTETGFQYQWKYYKHGLLFGLSAGYGIRQDISLVANILSRVRPYKSRVDTNLWFGTTTFVSGEPAIIHELAAGLRLHIRKIGKGAYLLCAGGLQLENIGVITKDHYYYYGGSRVYLVREKTPEYSRYRSIGMLGLGYDRNVVGRFFIGGEANLNLEFDRAHVAYALLAKFGLRL